MPITDRNERRILGGSLLALALSAAGLAAAFGIISQAHMTGLANLCGSPSEHCLACYGAAVALAAALVTGCAGLSFLGSPACATAGHEPEIRPIRS